MTKVQNAMESDRWSVASGQFSPLHPFTPSPATEHSTRACAERRAVARSVSPAHLFTSSPAHGPSARRGVLILVVLSLLFLFVLIAITFVLVATRQLAASKQYARTAVTGDPPQALLNEAMMQVLRGDTSSYVSSGTSPEVFHSVIGPHSLLESMYGPYTISGSISQVDPNGNATRTNASDASTDQVVEFSGGNAQLAVASFQNSPLGKNLSSATTSPLLLDGYLEGCLVTMTSGSAKGLTSRIVRFDATSSPPLVSCAGLQRRFRQCRRPPAIRSSSTAGPFQGRGLDTT